MTTTVNLKRVKGLRFGRSGESVTSRWIARDMNGARVGVGMTRKGAIADLRPVSVANKDQFVNSFLAAREYIPPLPRGS